MAIEIEMNKIIKNYLDNAYSARNLSGITFSGFCRFLTSCIVADGGKFHETHGYYETPPMIGGEWGFLSIDEVKKWWDDKVD